MKYLLKAAAGVLILGLLSCTQLQSGQSDREKLYWQAPVLLPGVTPDLRRPGFWIGRLKDPDSPILSQEQLNRFEQDLEDRQVAFALPLKSNQPLVPPLAEQLDQAWQDLEKSTLYLEDGNHPDTTWRTAVQNNLNRDKVAAETIRYALTTSWCEQRCFPTGEKLTVEPLDSDFDDAQLSAYDIGTPMAVFHESTDGQWCWTRTRLSDGWAPQSHLAFCDAQTLTDWSNRPAVTVTAVKADLWLDEGARTWGGWLRMGTRLPVEADAGRLWKVTLPLRLADGTLGHRSAWVAKEAAIPGALACTPRNIINQAFLFLDRSYGWGDMYGEQDCSRFLWEVFASVGIGLPRNSLFQAKAGLSWASFKRTDSALDKQKAVLSALAAQTLVRLDGHIMLYLGQVDGRPYAIHNLWAYRQKDSRGEILRVVNRTVVSPLDLGAGTSRGSLLDRILDIREITPRESPLPPQSQ